MNTFLKMMRGQPSRLEVLAYLALGAALCLLPGFTSGFITGALTVLVYGIRNGQFRRTTIPPANHLTRYAKK